MIRVAHFSVVVPAYNAAATLMETLDAVLVQSQADWECLIVDDGSTDDTLALAQSYRERDDRFRALHQENQGTAGAYNTGVLDSSGQYIVICSADDLLLPDHLAAMSAVIDSNPGYGIFSSNGEYLYESGKRETVYQGDEWHEQRSLSFEEVLGCCFFSVGATFARSVFDKVGGFRLGVYGEDYDFWLRAMAIGVRQLYTPEVLSVHRVSSAQKSTDLVRVFESNIEVYQHLLDSHLVRSGIEPTVKKAIADRTALLDTVLREQADELRRARMSNLLTFLIGTGAARQALRAARRAVARHRRVVKHK